MVSFSVCWLRSGALTLWRPRSATHNPLTLSMKKFDISSVILLALGSFLISCQDDSSSSKPEFRSSTHPLVNLPKDKGGVQTAFVLGANASPYGYYLYTPSDYKSTGPRFPLLIFLHGSGEVGNSSVNPQALGNLLVHGPPKMIQNGTWAPKYPMIVASAQCHEMWWDIDKVLKFTEFLMANYQVDTSRIYMTGLSMGGYATWDQIMMLGKKSHITAVVPICGGGAIYPDWTKNASQFPIWAFHGEEDRTVFPDFDIAIWKAINDLKPVIPAKLTLYPATGHDAWTETYNGTGMGLADPAYDPFDMDIYSWMFEYSK